MGSVLGAVEPEQAEQGVLSLPRSGQVSSPLLALTTPMVFKTVRSTLLIPSQPGPLTANPSCLMRQPCVQLPAEVAKLRQSINEAHARLTVKASELEVNMDYHPEVYHDYESKWF